MRRPTAAPMRVLEALVAALVLTAAACGPGDEGRARILLVTTTTVEGSGLLDSLVHAYHGSQDRYRLATTAVGSGAALEIGRRGDADLLLTHDSAGEAAFMAAGHGSRQGPVMRNEFIVVGPPADPAGVRGAHHLAAALDRIARSAATFVSRGDDSGTHRRERALWERAEASPAAMDDRIYIESGSGMAETLRIADQRQAYTLTDRGTFRHLSDALTLAPLAAGETPELNVYRFTLPREPRNRAGALDFLDWLLGPGQDVVRSYGAERFGEPLFQPAADWHANADAAADPSADASADPTADTAAGR